MSENTERANLSSSTQVRWRVRAKAEGRRHERVGLMRPVLIINHGVASDQHDEAVSIDVSESGAAFETEANLKLASLVELVFDVNEETEYRCYARLLYRFGPRYGAYFTKLD